MRELLVGTKKGLFVLHGDEPGSYEIATRAFPGDVVEYAMRDGRTGRYFASVTSDSHACGAAGYSRIRPTSAIFRISANLLVCQKSPLAWSR